MGSSFVIQEQVFLCVFSICFGSFPARHQAQGHPKLASQLQRGFLSGMIVLCFPCDGFGYWFDVQKAVLFHAETFRFEISFVALITGAYQEPHPNANTTSSQIFPIINCKSTHVCNQGVGRIGRQSSLLPDVVFFLKRNSPTSNVQKGTPIHQLLE